MADIDVVKKRSSVWPWVIGIVLLVLVLWLVASMMNSRTGTGATSPTSSLQTPQTMAAFALA
jgi:hypothetical protein